MANKTANFNLRMEPQVKKQAEELYARMGMTLADAVNIFIYKSLQVEGIPFDVNVNSPAVVKAPKAVKPVGIAHDLPSEPVKAEPTEPIVTPTVEEEKSAQTYKPAAVLREEPVVTKPQVEEKPKHRSSVQDLFRNM